MSASRNAILARLRSRNRTTEQLQEDAQQSDFSLYQQKNWSATEKLERFTQLLIATHAEVYLIEQEAELAETLQAVLQQKSVNQLLISEKLARLNPNFDEKIFAHSEQNLTPITRHTYQASPNDPNWQHILFDVIEASITTSACAVAETGSIILVPDQQEPRLMSLVPPIHIVIVEKDKIYNTLYEAIQEEQWHNAADSVIPTNIVMVSGPSKTADIEQTLAYGVHGPKELIVLLV